MSPECPRKFAIDYLATRGHVGCSKLLLHCVLSAFSATPVDASSASDAKQILQEAMDKARLSPLSVSRQIDLQPSVMPPIREDWEHWIASVTALHPLLDTPTLQPALATVYQRLASFPGDIGAFRKSVLQGVCELMSDRAEATKDWFESLSPHVRAANSLDSHGSCVQIPVFMELLRGSGYPECDELESDLCRGMPMIGEIRPTLGWAPRCDDKYSHPVDYDAFRKLNREHVQSRLRKGRIDEEWRPMLQEVAAEVRSGRLQGPYRAPASWGVETCACTEVTGFDELLPCPTEDPSIAWAFSVVQTGSDGRRKVRQCEDYRVTTVARTIMLRFLLTTYHLTMT